MKVGNKISIKLIVWILFVLLIGICSILQFSSLKLETIYVTDATGNLSYFISKKVVYFIAAVTCIFIFIGSMLMGSLKRISVEYRVFWGAMLLGILYIIYIPQSQTPDSFLHFSRVFDILQGNFLSEMNGGSVGGYLPQGLYGNLNFGDKYAQVLSNIGAQISPEVKEWYGFANTALYPPIAYIPQAIGTLLGKLISNNLMLITFLGRVSGLLFSSFLIYKSIKLIPGQVEIITIIAFLPIFLQEATAYSADYFVNALSIYYTAYMLHIAFVEKKMITIKNMIFIGVLTVSIGVCKVVYIPLALLLLLIPKDRFFNKKKYYGFIISVILLAAAFFGIWTLLTKDFIDLFAGDVNSSAQVLYIISHPISYLKVMYNTLLESGWSMIFECLGNGLGWIQNISVGYTVMISLLIVMLYIMFSDRGVNRTDRIKERLVLLTISISIIVLTFTSLYVQFNLVGAEYIEGLQGRYFIPLILPLAIAANPTLTNRNDKGNRLKYLSLFLGFVHIAAVTAVVQELCL